VQVVTAGWTDREAESSVLEDLDAEVWGTRTVITGASQSDKPALAGGGSPTSRGSTAPPGEPDHRRCAVGSPTVDREPGDLACGVHREDVYDAGQLAIAEVDLEFGHARPYGS
jgi:hypothetical protein